MALTNPNSGTVIDPRYGTPGYQWGGNTDDITSLYSSEHRINSETGALEGPLGVVPAHLGLLYQGEHDRAVFAAKYRMGREALNYAQGATGLLQSFRPGGAATMEANAYGNMAQIQLQRANMLQPMDLLSDFRRDQLAQAGRSGRKERTTGAILQGVGALVSLIPGGQGAGAALFAGGSAVSASGNARGQISMARRHAAGQLMSGNLGQPGQPGQGGQGGQPGLGGGLLELPPEQGPPSPGALPPEQGPPSPGAGQSGGPEGPPSPGLLGQPGGAPGQPGQPPGAGQQGQGAPGGAPPGGPGVGPGGPGGAGQVVGAADRDFTPGAYAQNAAASSIAPVDTQVALTEHMVQMLEEDEMMNTMPLALDREFAMRGMIPA